MAERVAAMKESGVTTLNVAPMAPTHAERIALIEQIKDLAGLTAAAAPLRRPRQIRRIRRAPFGA